jgi:5'-3' exonuclease, N-terminal resolvase-like domain
MNYIIVDTANCFFRARHVVRGTADEKIGMALHVTLASIKKAWQDFKGDHVVFCLEGRSWRKDYYAPYKRNRTEARAALTEKEAEEDKMFWETFDKFKEFINEKTNCTVLQNPRLEADDLIAGWIESHPSDNHIIISTDSDFVQLIAPNVKQYNGVMEQTITSEGIFDKKGKRVIDNKTKEPKVVPNPEWLLFEKCMRGDPTDNVFSAYPKVRKNKLEEAFEDRKNKGFVWNNMMLQRWVDHNGEEHRVLDDYERNKQLIDLKAQPDDIKAIIFETIKTNSVSKSVDQVGMRLLKFCGLFDLVKISEQAQAYAEPLNAKYMERT